VSNVFGRTNQHFPPVWLRLSLPTSSNALPDFAAAALDAQVPLDISSGPALWGGWMRSTDRTLLLRSDPLIERAPDEKGAADLTQAHLIETLSSIGREWLDFYVLRARKPLEEFQINGYLSAVEAARQEGHVRFFGLAVEGSPLAAQSIWQFHDAFDALIAAPPISPSLNALATERRVGVLEEFESSQSAHSIHSKLIRVGSIDEIQGALGTERPS
jgi:hypothetical protein